MKGGDEPEVVQKRGPQITGKLVHNVDRFFHQPLGAHDLAVEVSAVDDGFFFQDRQMDIDSVQGLGDFIMQFAADLFALFFLRRQNLMGQMTQLFVHKV